MKAGFIGLGHLGSTLARRLLSEGVELVVWNRSAWKTEGLGTKVAESPASLVSETEITFVNLFGSAAVEAVLNGERGVLRGDLKGKIIIDTTTNHFKEAEKFHALFKERGGHYLECPVLGSVIPASRGELVVLVSGEKEAYEKALPYLHKIGKEIIFLEKPSLATKMKLVNNLVFGSFIAALAEGIILAEEAGVGKERAIEILQKGAGNSAVLTAKKEKLLTEDFSTHFSFALMYKDLHIMQDLARELRRPLFTGSTAKELYALSFLRGMETLDVSALYKVLKEY